MSLSSRLSLASTLALLGALSAPTAALATGAQWDSAAAGFNGNGATSATPWVGTPAVGSVLAEWNFIQSTNDLSPDIAGSGSLVETTGSAFATSGGNIYSFSGATAFTATLDALGSGSWDVYLRVATLGTSVLDAATLNGVSATRTLTYTEAITGGFGGGEEENLWVWSGVHASSLVLQFGASASSMSLDQVAIYAAPVASVPEPSTWLMMLAGLGAVGTLSRRHSLAVGR